MLKIGITGGIGSGKTVVCRLFELLDIPVYNADLSAKGIMDKNPAVKKILSARFGKELYQEGILNRKRLAGIIFDNPELLAFVNHTVHPVVLDDFRKWSLQHSSKPYILKEAAILFESGFDKELDAVILVTAPEKSRIERVMKRDGLREEDIRKRMSQQMPEEEKKQRADFMILNDQTQALIPQVLKIDRLLRSGQKISR